MKKSRFKDSDLLKVTQLINMSKWWEDLNVSLLDAVAHVLSMPRKDEERRGLKWRQIQQEQHKHL